MELRLRYKKLNFWNKIAFWGSSAGILAIPLAVIIWLFPQKAQLEVNWPEVIEEIKAAEKASQSDVFASRTFSILKEPGATITLGHCPSETCMKFSLGKINNDNGMLFQEVILDGSGFGIRRKPVTKYQIEMISSFEISGGYFDVSLAGKPPIIGLGLKKNSRFELFTYHADIIFTVVDLNAESLRIRLDAKPPSSKRL